jgi:hypothetical protein
MKSTLIVLVLFDKNFLLVPSVVLTVVVVEN